MGINKYVSEVKTIDHGQEVVFEYLSNFENLSEHLNSEMLETISQKIPQVKIRDFESDRDSCRFHISGFGEAQIRIVDREPHKTIKVESSGKLPMDLVFWIQLLPVSESKTKMRLTLHADLNMMMKMMVGGKLEDGVNQLAETIKNLPYK